MMENSQAILGGGTWLLGGKVQKVLNWVEAADTSTWLHTVHFLLTAMTVLRIVIVTNIII